MMVDCEVEEPPKYTRYTVKCPECGGKMVRIKNKKVMEMFGMISSERKLKEGLRDSDDCLECGHLYHRTVSNE